MKTTDIFILIAVFSFLAVRLYQKYVKKDKTSNAKDRNIATGSTPFSSSKDDDYEPYSKKQF